MKIAKVCLFAAILGTGLGGTAILSTTAPKAEAAPAMASHWRYHDGHWSYWHAGDNRWYYTDGVHWFYADGAVWKLYPFDRAFGRGDGFVHAEYKVPVEREREKIIVPRHGVYHPG